MNGLTEKIIIQKKDNNFKN